MFDNRDTHWLINDSDKDQTMLIVGIRTDMFKGK